MTSFSTQQLPANSSAVHSATLWRGIKSGRYSKPIELGPQIRRFLRSELKADIDRAVAERDQKAVKRGAAFAHEKPQKQRGKRSADSRAPT
jgi:predicted DNA-binding transcriptional regulator AlpA